MNTNDNLRSYFGRYLARFPIKEDLIYEEASVACKIDFLKADLLLVL
jgi:hypothetical protein